MKLNKNIHKLWHGFCKHVMNKYKSLEYKKMHGYGCMKHIDKYVKKHPEIEKIQCDDAFFASSSLYLIPHESKDEYFGTTMIFVPQCTDQQNQIFLYDNHVDQLVEALLKIKKKHKDKEM